MNQLADSFNNPFKVDGKTVPPMRSALAVLDAEREELDDPGIDAVLRRALAAYQRDPDVFTVYGRSVDEDDLRAAADKLREPLERALSQLLDYSYERFELGEVDELREAVSDYRERLCREAPFRVADLHLVGALIERICRDPKLPADEPEPMDAPELPSLEDLLSDIA